MSFCAKTSNLPSPLNFLFFCSTIFIGLTPHSDNLFNREAVINKIVFCGFPMIIYFVRLWGIYRIIFASAVSLLDLRVLITACLVMSLPVLDMLFPMTLAMYWQHKGLLKKLVSRLYPTKTQWRRLWSVYVMQACYFGSMLIYTAVMLRMTLQMSATMQRAYYTFLGIPLLGLGIDLWIVVAFPLWTAFFAVSLIRVTQVNMCSLNAELAEIKAPTVQQLHRCFYRQHEIHDAVNVLSQMFSFYMLMNLVIDVPASIGFVFFSMTGSEDSQNIYPAVIALQVKLLVTSWSAAVLNEEISETAAVVTSNAELRLNGDTEVRHSAQMIVDQTINFPGLDMCGFARVTKGFVVTIISISVTYLTLLLQFQDPADMSVPLNETALASALNH